MNVDKDFTYAPSSSKAKDWQSAILEEMRLFDELCRENDIDYFIYGGGLLGATRHRGFIPWDNDVDVSMTEENYLKLVALCKEGKFPANHTLVCRETEDGYPLLFARFINTNTSCPLSTSAFNGGDHGLFLDVFIMFPLPDGPGLQEGIDNFLVWEELLCYLKIRSSKRNPSFIAKWKAMKAYEAEHGHEAALAHAEELFRKCLTDKPAHYLFGSGGSRNAYPYADAEWYSESVRIPFADLQVPAPKGYYEMMRRFYGNSWRRFPKNEPQFQPYNGANLNIPGKVVSEDYMQLIDAEACDRDFRLLKELEAKLMVIENPYLEINYDALCELIGEDITKELAGKVENDKYSKASTYNQDSFDVDAALAQYEKLGVISNEQLRNEMKTWHSPILMEASYIASALWIRLSILYDFWAPIKVASLQERNPLFTAYLETEDGKTLNKLFDTIADMYTAMDSQDKAAVEVCVSFLDQNLPHSVHAKVGHAFLLRGDDEACLAYIEKQHSLFKQNDYMRLFMAEALAHLGRLDEATVLISQILHYSTSGLIRLWASDFCKLQGINPLAKKETDAPVLYTTPEYELHSLNRYGYGFRRWPPIFKRAGFKMSSMRKERESLLEQIEEVEERVQAYRNARRLTDRRFQTWERAYPRKQALLDAAEAGDEELILKLARPYVDAFHSTYTRYGYGLFIDEDFERIVLPILRKKDGDKEVQKRIDAIPSCHRVNIDQLLRDKGVDHPYLR